MYGRLLPIALALALAGAAFYRSRSPGGHYDEGVYGMTRQTHLRYAGAATAFAAAFLGLAFVPWDAVRYAAEGAFAVVAVFYVTSFLRGAETDG